MPPHRPLLAAVLLACLSWTGPSLAADHAKEFVPELNAFVKLTAQTRVYLLGDLTVQRSDKSTEVETGAHIDSTLVPVLRPHLRAAGSARDRCLWTRLDWLVPYARAETVYDTRYDRRIRPLHQAGIEISRTWRFEPCLARQNDSVSAAGNADRLGLVLEVCH